MGGGSRANEGYVEALGSNGTWGGVCDDWWNNDHGKSYGMKNANVICQMLGYSSAEAFFDGPEKYWNQHSFGNNPHGESYVLDDLKCTGAESSIFDCTNQGGEWNENCNADEIAGVRCAT